MNRVKTKKVSQIKDHIFTSAESVDRTQTSSADALSVEPSVSGQTDGAAASLEVVLDIANANRIAGWGWNPAQPQQRLTLNIFFDDVQVATVTADSYRKDLKSAKKGDGHYGFEWSPDASLVPARGCLVTLRQVGYDAVLGAPKPILVSGSNASAGRAGISPEV